MPEVSLNDIAKLLMMTPRHIQRLAQKGTIPVSTKGKYSLVESVQGYIKYLKEQAAHTGHGLVEERRKNIRLKNESDAYKLKILREEHVAIEEIKKVVGGMIIASKSQLRNVPSRAAPTVTVCGDVVKNEKYLRREINDALSTLTDITASSLGFKVSGGALETPETSKPK